MKGGNKAGFARVLARHHASVRPLLQFAISAESDVSSVSATVQNVSQSVALVHFFANF